MSNADEIDLERLVREVPARFGKRTVELAPACVLAYDASTWQDAIVFVIAMQLPAEFTGPLIVAVWSISKPFAGVVASSVKYAL